MIKLADLRKSFGKQKVLDGLDLEIEAGKTTVIIGRSGGGKVSFLNTSLVCFGRTAAKS